MRCDQCKHWKPSNEWEANASGFRECVGVRTRWKIEDEAVGGLEKYPTSEATIEFDYEDVGVRWMEAMTTAFQREKAYVQDGSQYRAELFTGPDFFCAKFEAGTYSVE